MSQTKVAITIDEGVLAKVDALVSRKVFGNRSRAIQEAGQEKLERLARSPLVDECAKLDPVFEKAMADEGLSEELHGRTLVVEGRPDAKVHTSRKATKRHR